MSDEIEWSAESLLNEEIDGKIFIEVGSSFIEAVSYDLLTHILIVSINGNDTVYFNVSFNLFWRFVNDPSKGRFYNTHIKGRF